MKRYALGFIAALVVSFSGLTAESFVFATYPFGEEENIYAAFSALTDYLSEETGDEFRLIITQDYGELSERIVEGSVDFAWIGSSNYVKTSKIASHMVYLATYSEWNHDRTEIQPYYQSVILTLASSPYDDLASLEGRRFAFTSPDSTSGYAYPRMIFDRLEIVPEEYFRSVFFLGRHVNVIKALMAGSIDGGACSDGTYYKAVQDYGEIFRIVVSSEPIPLDAVVALDHVDAGKREEIRSLLVSLEPAHSVNESIWRHLSWPSAGFEEKSPSFYDSVEKAMEIKGSP